MIFYERPFVRISWNEEAKLCEIRWSGFAFGEPYREGADRLLDLHREKACSRSMSDMRKAGVMDTADAQWLLDEWTPRAKAAGVRSIAMIVPESVVAHLQLEQLSKKSGRQRMDELEIAVEYFVDYEAALRWVVSR